MKLNNMITFVFTAEATQFRCVFDYGYKAPVPIRFSAETAIGPTSTTESY